jgi:Xaa-Pro aminopeptidase
VSGDTPLRPGEVLLIDFGTIYKGYVSDITRTFFVGEPSGKARAVYEAVRAANEAGRQAARPGITAEDVDRVTGDVMRTAGFGEYIVHRTGHGLGIDIHEHPNIVAGNKRPLEAGMVFTVEPGLYIPGELGVRIEDNVAVTVDGAESLTRFPRELTVLALQVGNG